MFYKILFRALIIFVVMTFMGFLLGAGYEFMEEGNFPLVFQEWLAKTFTVRVIGRSVAVALAVSYYTVKRDNRSLSKK